MRSFKAYLQTVCQSNICWHSTLKLTKEERDAVNAFAESRGIARGQWIREVVLEELASTSKNSDASLAEIIGVRLLLVNVLRPLAAGKLVSTETFDRFLD